MIINQFIKVFGKISKKFYWSIDKEDCLRGQLRGSHKKYEYCPITAVVKVEKGKKFGPRQADKAAKHIDLPSGSIKYASSMGLPANQIILASDGDGDEKIRKSLIKAIGAKRIKTK